jgi:hypothetical protein
VWEYESEKVREKMEGMSVGLASKVASSIITPARREPSAAGPGGFRSVPQEVA